MSPVSTFTMSLTEGWNQIPNGVRPSAGDLVALAVLSPRHVAVCTASPGWATDGGGLFWKFIGPAEPDPVLHAACDPAEWLVQGWCLQGASPSDLAALLGPDDAALVVDGNADGLVGDLRDGGWELDESRTTVAGGRRVRFLKPPDDEKEKI